MKARTLRLPLRRRILLSSSSREKECCVFASSVRLSPWPPFDCWRAACATALPWLKDSRFAMSTVVWRN